MKIILSILLLLITSTYILPVKELFAIKNSVCMADMDEEKGDTGKKEKAKELFSFTGNFILVKNSCNYIHLHFTHKVAILLHTVETPPPNFI